MKKIYANVENLDLYFDEPHLELYLSDSEYDKFKEMSVEKQKECLLKYADLCFNEIEIYDTNKTKVSHIVVREPSKREEEKDKRHTQYDNIRFEREQNGWNTKEY